MNEARASQPRGMRVVLDARPLQDPARSPMTARYLDRLLEAYDANPIRGESFAFLLQSDLDDPTTRFDRLEVVGRRLLPPTRLLRSAALSVDPFLLRGASIGVAWRADRGGAAGAVHHAVAGAAPLFSGLPVVVTLLDLAPWELPAIFQRGPVARFGQRLRLQLLRDAAAVIVTTPAVARQARRLLRIPADHLAVVPLAPDPAFVAAGLGAVGDGAGAGESPSAERERLGLPERYLVYAGRYDARHDLRTLLGALAALAAEPRPRGLGRGTAWPPTVLLVGASPDDRAAVARSASRDGVGDHLVYAPVLASEALAEIVAAARAVVHPARSDSAALPIIDALAAHVPVVASAVGAVPDLVGSAGLLVPPGDVERLATALRSIWSDDRLRASLVVAAAERPSSARTWDEVAAETRRVYEAAVTR